MIRRKVFFSLIRKLEKQLKLGLVLLTYSRIASKQQATVFHLFGFVEFILSLSLSLSLSPKCRMWLEYKYFIGDF